MTTENKWTPEPWAVDEDGYTKVTRTIDRPTDALPVFGMALSSSPVARANTLRIVATINACAPNGPVAELLAAAEKLADMAYSADLTLTRLQVEPTLQAALTEAQAKVRAAIDDAREALGLDTK